MLSKVKLILNNEKVNKFWYALCINGVVSMTDNNPDHHGGDMPIEIASIKLYSVNELSQHLKVTSYSIRAYIRDGRLKAQKIGGRWYVAEENLQQFLRGDYFATVNMR